MVEPFHIPSNWTKFRACDYGYGSYSAVVWFAVAPSEQLVVYRELYVSKVLATDLADMILDEEAEDGNIKYGVLDSSLWHKRGDTGPSLAEQMIMKGCRLDLLIEVEEVEYQVKMKYIDDYKLMNTPKNHVWFFLAHVLISSRNYLLYHWIKKIQKI